MAEVVVYTEPDYKGQQVTLPHGKYIMNKKLDNKISSFKIPSGYAVMLYDNPDFTGDPKVFNKDQATLGDEINDTCSSMVVINIEKAMRGMAASMFGSSAATANMMAADAGHRGAQAAHAANLEGSKALSDISPSAPGQLTPDPQ